jgi:cell division protein FtsL
MLTFNETRSEYMQKSDATKYKSINFIRNTLRNIIKVFPSLIVNNVNYESIDIPKHWKLSQLHGSDIKKILRNHYASLYKYYGVKELTKILNKITIIGDEIYVLAENTPYLPSINQGAEELTSIFDDRMTTLLYNYYLLTTLQNYINLVDDPEMIITEAPKSKEISQLMGAGEYDEEAIGELDEIEMVLGDKKQFAEHVASLLVTFIKIVQVEKETIDYNNEQIIEKVLRSKEKEKNDITRDLEKLSKEERLVETLKKKNKLGDWNIGLQKGLTRYVGEFYDNEREEIEQRALEDIRLGKNLDVIDMNREIYRMDLLERKRADEELDREAYDMSGLPNDDDFGDREDREDVEGYAYMMDDARMDE